MGRIATSSVGLAVVALVGCASPAMLSSDAATVDAPGDAPWDAPDDAPGDAAPDDARADAPWDAPDDAPGDAPWDAPDDARDDAAPTDAPGDAPWDAPDDARADAPWDAPDDARADAAPVTDADLAIAIVDTPDPATVGLPLMFQVTLTNNGPAAATSVFFELQTDPTIAITGMPSGCTSISQGFQCAVGVMASGAVLTFDATALPGSAAAGRETRVILFNANEPDPISGNNTATATTTVDPPP